MYIVSCHVHLPVTLCLCTGGLYSYGQLMLCTHVSLCVPIYIYMHTYHPFVCFCAIMLNNRSEEAAHMSILTGMHKCNFEGEVCVWLISILLWTCAENCGHMDGLNINLVSISH